MLTRRIAHPGPGPTDRFPLTDPAPTPPDGIPLTSGPFVRLVDLPRVRGLAGVCLLVLLLNGLGLGAPAAHLATDAVLAIIGFQIGLEVRRQASHEPWTGRYLRTVVAPIVVPAMVAITLAVVYWWWVGRLDEAEAEGALAAFAMVSNLLPLVSESQFPATQHLWLVALIVQTAVAAPLTAAVARRPGGGRRAVKTIIALALAVALFRLGVIAAGADPATVAQITPTRVDGLLLGMAVALTPRSLLQMVPSGVAIPALTILVSILVLAPTPSENPTLVLGLLSPLVVLSTAAILATMNADHRRSWITIPLGRLGLRWVGERAICIYVWHQLFGMALADETTSDIFGGPWPGLGLFLTRLVFALAAGAASYRYLHLPLRTMGDPETAPMAGPSRRPALGTA